MGSRMSRAARPTTGLSETLPTISFGALEEMTYCEGVPVMTGSTVAWDVISSSVIPAMITCWVALVKIS